MGQDIERMVRAVVGPDALVVRTDPGGRGPYKRLLEETILAPGVKVIIADKECGITYHRKVFREERKIIKKHGYLPRKTHMNVTPEVCENCLECTKATSCPGLISIDTDYGRKIDTDLTWCVNDGACERVRVSNTAGTTVKPCPSFEQVTVVRKRRRRYKLPHMALDKLPDPTHVHQLNAPGDVWRIHMSGVGGMGIGVVTAILVRAGHKQGYKVIFTDKKGLAIRNGGASRFGVGRWINPARHHRIHPLRQGGPAPWHRRAGGAAGDRPARTVPRGIAATNLHGVEHAQAGHRQHVAGHGGF
jgi:indolepyruvate ferredoxin oxidoreductase